MTVMASATVMADVVPDLLILEGGDIYDHRIQIDDMTSFKLDANNGELLMTGDKSEKTTKVYMFEKNGYQALGKAYLTWRDSRKLSTPRFAVGGASKLIGKHGNGVHAEWYPVKGASGYEIRARYHVYGSQEEGALAAGPVTVDAQTLSHDINNLEYSSNVLIEIRALSAEGEEFNSDWCSRSGNSLIPWNNLVFMTEGRYAVPEVTSVTNHDKTSFRVNLHLSYAESGDNADKGYSENFEIGNDGNFVADRLQVIPLQQTATPEAPARAASEADWRDYAITDADRAAGYIDVTGLQEATTYQVTLINSNIPSAPDARYNTLIVKTKGGDTTPILIPHSTELSGTVPGAAEYEACPIDKILNEYATDPFAAEDQTYWLEGGKAYCIGENVTLVKGITLKTNPADVAAGKRAIVYMGCMSTEPSIVTSNFILGRAPETGEPDIPLSIGDIKFENIDFDCPLAMNYGKAQQAQQATTGNYFANMYSNGMEFTISSLTLEGCTFRNFIRGFVRVQGSKSKVIEKLTVNNCLFSDCGYYDKNGKGYAWFAGDGANVNSNIFADVTFSNNTIYDSPMSSLFTDNNKTIEYAAGVKWNIKVFNNTFFNFSTRSNSRFFFDMRYVPSGSHISFERNLLVQAADDNDARPLNLSGADIRTIKGAGEFSFTIKDNYSAASRAANQGDDKVFTAGAFSATKNSFGTLASSALDCTAADLVVKQLTADDGSVITPAQLFNNPNPVNAAYDAANYNALDHAAPADINEALKFKTLPATISDKNVGDPRWR